VTYDVVVVGAGVAGLTAAIGAGRVGGARTLVIDQRGGPDAGPDVHKGEFLQPSSLEILAVFGVEAELRRRGAISVEALECRDAAGRRLGAFDYRLLAHRFDHGLVHAHAHIRSALLAEAARGADVRFGARAAGLLHDGRGRTAGVVVADADGRVERVPARLVVGADGPGSAVRRRLGIRFERTVYRHRFAAFDVPAGGLPPRIVCFLTRGGARIAYPMPGGRARLYVQVSDRRRRAGADWLALLRASCPGLRDLLDPAAADLAAPQWFGAWRGAAISPTAGGVVLVGDAAHAVHPMAGQGMNAAIGDGWALWQALGRLGSGADVQAGLDRYARVRGPQVREAGHVSDRLARLCTTRSGVGLWLVRGVLARNGANRALQQAATRRLAGLQRGRFTAREWLQVVTGR
jgi:2-polyprenyl-6-methoxyphenol hydroxylase-like FAD-dependent oxidoreductase